MADYREGQKLKGSDGQVYVVVNGVPTLAAQPMQSLNSIVPPNPNVVARQAADDARKIEDQRLQREAAERSQVTQDRIATSTETTAKNQNFDNLGKLRSAFDGSQAVKDYREGIVRLTSGLKTANNPQGDNALIYAYAKTMDPGATVQVSEAEGISNSDTAFGRAYAYAKKQLDNTGSFSPEARAGLRREMINQGVQLNLAYETERERYADDATAEGFDPARIIGKHFGGKFLPDIKAYAKSQRKPGPNAGGVNYDKRLQSTVDGKVRVGDWAGANAALVAAGKDPIALGERAKIQKFMKENPGQPISALGTKVPAADNPALDAEEDVYAQSIVGQGMSGVNKGLATLAGAPVDLMTGAVNLGTTGINALTNSDIPRIENPTLGSQWFKETLLNPMGAIGPKANTTSGEVASRVGESVGASLLPAGMARSALGAGGQLLAGAMGGAGGAAAQQAFPGNPLAEMAGELGAGGLTGYGLARSAQRGAQRSIEAAIPSVDELKAQAGSLYRQAETRGITADPVQTRQLADEMRQTLAREGQIGPLGKVTDADAATTKAFGLVEQYADLPMRPVEMDAVRGVLSASRKSPKPEDQRLGGILLSQFDDWTRPLAPEFDDARDISSRYLQAEDLEEARNLAESSAGQFTGSGFENALRTQYRGLDRAEIKDRLNFTPEVADAVRTVARGTDASNLARNIGKWAPTGVVSSALGGGAVGALAGSAFGAPVGVLAGALTAGAGRVGRNVATNMGIRAADQAELVARNGGAIPQAQFASPEIMESFRNLMLAEAAKYQSQ